MRRIGIVLKTKSQRAKDASNILISYLQDKSVDYFIIYSEKGPIDQNLLEKIPDSDLCITFGGDGTLLFASRVIKYRNEYIVWKYVVFSNLSNIKISMIN